VSALSGNGWHCCRNGTNSGGASSTSLASRCKRASSHSCSWTSTGPCAGVAARHSPMRHRIGCTIRPKTCSRSGGCIMRSMQLLSSFTHWGCTSLHVTTWHDIPLVLLVGSTAPTSWIGNPPGALSVQEHETGQRILRHRSVTLVEWKVVEDSIPSADANYYLGYQDWTINLLPHP